MKGTAVQPRTITSTLSLVNIALGEITPAAGNRRTGGMDEADLADLAQSIRETGVHEPAIVRPIHYDLDSSTEGPGEDWPRYELVAGERRWRASRLAGVETLPCIVRELSDVEAVRIRVIENMQRQDLHPLDEADGYAQLLQADPQATPATIADQVGRSRKYVYQRLRLRDLVDEIREPFAKREISLSVALAFARVPAAMQARCMEDCSRYGGEVSVRDVDGWLERFVLHDLNAAGFKMTDAELIPDAGPCTTCRKHTGAEPDLFGEPTKRIQCLDPECFAAKGAACVTRKIAEFEEKDIEFVRVTPEWSGRKRKDGVEYQYDRQECRKKDDRSVMTILVDGPQTGKTYWSRSWRTDSDGLSQEPTTYRVQNEIGYERPKAITAELVQRVVATSTRALDQLLIDLLANRSMAAGTKSALERRGKKVKTLQPQDVYSALADLERYDLEAIATEIIVEGMAQHVYQRWYGEPDQVVRKRVDRLLEDLNLQESELLETAEQRMIADLTDKYGSELVKAALQAEEAERLEQEESNGDEE
jgi:ParB/RepB/Spo0J family partition protein